MSDDDLTLQLIAERLRSLRELFDTRFDSMEQQVRATRDLPRRIERLETKVDDGMRRVEHLEEDEDTGAEWRRTQLPVIVLTLALVMVGLGQVLAAVLHA